MFLGFLLPVCLGLLIFDLLRRLEPAMDLREVLLIEAILLGAAVVVSTEILNAFVALTTWEVFGWWGLVCLGVNHYRVRLPRGESPGSRLRVYFRETSRDALGIIVVIAILTVTLMLVGLFATPNNYDSMTYHLARVAHWRQDRSISFYGTNISRQNFMPPWAEWVMLQLTLLQGSDRLVNLVQWICYVGCMIGAGLVTELLGGKQRDGILAAFFVATLPGATFEATSTQNDLVMSFWLICLVYACLKLSLDPGRWGTFLFGMSLGLALLTKTVTMIFAAPFCLWAVWTLAGQGLRKSLPRLAVIAVAALALNAGHAARNFAASGHLLGPEEHDRVGSHYLNDTHSLGAIFSNVLRNASLHASLFHEKSGPEEMVIKILGALGIDPRDPRTTFNGGAYSIWEGGEDGTPMPLHLAVIGLSFIALIWNYRRFGFAPIALALSVLAGALLFCLILKWQPFHARLHLPLFILSAPLAALTLGGLFGRGFTWPVLVLFLLTSVPNVFWYVPRAALGSFSVFTTSDNFQQFFRQPQLARPYLEAKHILSYYRVREVGLIFKDDDWEYPLLMSQHEPVPWRSDHMLIENAYAPLESTRVPDALLCTRPGLGEVVAVHGHPYRLVRTYFQRQNHDLILSIYFSEYAASGEPPPKPNP